MEIFISESQETPSLFIEILCYYLKIKERNLAKIIKVNKSVQSIIQIKNIPMIIANESAISDSNIITLAKQIATQGCFHDILFGLTEEEKKTIETFTNHIINDLKYESQPILSELNTNLLLNTFINGSLTVTICDLLSFAIVGPLINQMSNEDKNKHSNVIRWADHILHLPGIKESSSELKIAFSTPYQAFIIKEEVVKKKEKKDKGKGKPIEGEAPKEGEQQAQPKQEKDKKKKAPEQKDVHLMSKVDIRVGKVVNIFPNPEADKLFNEEIDVGNGEIRKIASGLRNRVDINDLKDSLVVVICNLEPRNLKGWESHGMILCASTPDDKVEPLRPPQDSKPGDLVYIGDLPREPVPDKKNPWSKVCKDLIVNEKNQATYKKEFVWKTDKGDIVSMKYPNATIS